MFYVPSGGNRNRHITCRVGCGRFQPAGWKFTCMCVCVCVTEIILGLVSAAFSSWSHVIVEGKERSSIRHV
jgi:hypothetical protein